MSMCSYRFVDGIVAVDVHLAYALLHIDPPPSMLMCLMSVVSVVQIDLARILDANFWLIDSWLLMWI